MGKIRHYDRKFVQINTPADVFEKLDFLNTVFKTFVQLIIHFFFFFPK